MKTAYADGRGQDEEGVFNAFGAFLRNADWDWVELGEIREFLDQRGFSNQQVWKAVNAYSSAGLVKSIERGEKTNLKLLRDEWDVDDLLQHDAGGSTEEEWADLYAVNDWARIGETRVPTLDTAVFEDFLERHGYDDADVFRYAGEHVDTVASYDATSTGVEYWRILENDAGREQDRLALMVRFEDDAGFQPNNRTSYAEKVWTPFTVLQQRNAWVNEASREAVEALEPLRVSWEAPHMAGTELTLEEAVLRELTSLAGFNQDDMPGYGELVAEAARRYAEHDDVRPSRLLAPYTAQVESRFTDDFAYVLEGPLSIGTDHGRARTPALIETHLDNVYREATRLSR